MNWMFCILLKDFQNVWFSTLHPTVFPPIPRHSDEILDNPNPNELWMMKDKQFAELDWNHWNRKIPMTPARDEWNSSDSIKMRSQSVITWLEYFKNVPDVFQHRILENYAVLHLGNYAVLLSFDTQTIHVFCIVVFKIATIENWFPFCPSWINSVVKRFFGNVWKSENLSHGVTFLSNLACRQPRTAKWTDPSVLSFS